jgi:hypothetical protein
MNSKVCFIILSYLCATDITAKADIFDDFISSFEVEMKSMKLQMHKAKDHAAKALKQAEQSVKHFSSNLALGVDVKLVEDKDSIKAIINLQGAGKAVDKASKVDIEAKGKALDGTLKHGNYNIKFTITDGQIMRISYKYNVNQKDKNFFQQASSTSTESVILPVRVSNLENTKANFSGNKLVLVLPKDISTGRGGWHRIEVK